MNYKNYRDEENFRRRRSSPGLRSREFESERPSHEFDDDNYYYGGLSSQREDWSSRAFDNNPWDRREGMYDAGGRDFNERARDAYGFGNGAQNDWYRRRNSRARWTGGDRGWEERQNHAQHGILDSVKNFFGVGPKGYKRSDERIREDVSEALARHPEIDASDMEVQVKDGHVTLSGSVESRAMRRMAEEAVEGVRGVEDVRLDLSVSKSSDLPGASSLSTQASSELPGSRASAPRRKPGTTREGRSRFQ